MPSPLVLPRSDQPERSGLAIAVFAGASHEPDRPTLAPVLHLSWTPTHLLADIRVNDDTPAESDNPDQLYTGDSVELLLSTGNRDDGMTQLVVTPTGRWQVLEYRNERLRGARVEPVVKVETTPGGYTARLALPFAAMGITPSEGMVIGCRVQVNDSDGKGRTWKRTLLGYDTKVEFFDLPKFTLGPAGSTLVAPEDLLAVWVDSVDLGPARIYVAYGAEIARKNLVISSGGKPLTPVASTAAPKGSIPEVNYAVYSLVSPAPGQTYPAVEFSVDGLGTRQVPLPDLIAARTRVFQSGAANTRGFSYNSPSWTVPTMSADVFSGTSLTRLQYADLARAEQAFGKISITTEYFDGRYRRVAQAHRPGRYAAVSRIVSEVGEAVAFHTLYRIPGADPATFPARQDGKRSTAADLAAVASGTDWVAKSERDWWYPLQKSLGLAKPYELFVRLPAGYDEHPDRLYPVIVYLHGSGGGDRISSVLIDGPQGYAAKAAGFDFIVVSLRSPGGWNPPQVNDTLGALAPTVRHDPSMWYLTGFSMGGMGTWTVAIDDPDRWAAIAPVGGRSGDPARAARLKEIPAWVFNGAADGVTTSKDALVAVEALRQAGNTRVKWTEFSGADHVDSLRLAYAMPELYAWFLSNRRQ